MLKKGSLLLLLTVIGIKTFSQYIEYHPVSTAPLENKIPIVNPQPLPLPPIQAYLPPIVSTENKGGINVLYTTLIKKAKINGKDVSQHYINANSGIILYTIKNKPGQCMAIAMPGENTFSYGSMSGINTSEIPQDSTTFGKTILLFTWEYNNSLDDKKGTATVTITKEYRPGGTFVSCHVLEDNGNTSDYNGIVIQ